MVKSTMFKWLAYGLLIFSAISTFTFFWQDAITSQDRFLAIFYTIIFEPVKAVFIVMFLFLRNQKYKKFALFCLITWVIFEVASISASTSLMMNKERRVQVQAVMDNPDYKANQNQIALYEQEVKMKQEEINKASSNTSEIIKTNNNASNNNATAIQQYNNNITEWQRQLEEKKDELQYYINKTTTKTPYTTTKANINSEIESLNQRINEATKARDAISPNIDSNSLNQNQEYINSLNKSISELNTKIEELRSKAIAMSNTNGYSGFFDQLAIIINTILGIVKNPNLAGKDISFAFNFILFGIAPELGGILSYVWHKTGRDILFSEVFNFVHDSPTSMIKDAAKEGVFDKVKGWIFKPKNKHNEVMQTNDNMSEHPRHVSSTPHKNQDLTVPVTAHMNDYSCSNNNNIEYGYSAMYDDEKFGIYDDVYSDNQKQKQEQKYKKIGFDYELPMTQYGCNDSGDSNKYTNNCLELPMTQYGCKSSGNDKFLLIDDVISNPELSTDSEHRQPMTQYGSKILKNKDIKSSKFYCDINNLTYDDIIGYLKFMYDNLDDNQAPGQQRFRRKFTDKTIRGIRYYLNFLGIIQTIPESKKTIVKVRNFADAVSLVSKDFNIEITKEDMVFV